MQQQTPRITEEKTKQTNIVEESEGQLSLFGERNPNEADVIDAINQLNLLAMTPLDAINTLSQLQQKLK